MMHCTVIILIIVCGACLISDVQSVQCSLNGTLRRVRRFFRKDQLQNNVPECTAEEFKRFNEECQRLMVAPNPPPTEFNIDQPATRDSPRGHTSEVVRVDFGEIKKPYAVKRIRMPWIAANKDANAYRDTCTEIKLLQNIEHPFIVKLHWSLWNKKYAVMIFDYEMGTLFDLIVSTGPWSEEKAKFYAAQLVLVVEYLHETKHIVHRDIKLENILVDSEGYLKVTDFGSSVIDNDELISDFAGTIIYAAPEVLIAVQRKRIGNIETYLRKPADIWSLGIVIYTMLFGKFPYDCDDADSMLRLMNRNVSLPEHKYIKIEQNRQGKLKAKYHKSTEKLTIGVMLLGMLNRDFIERLIIKEVKDHESWNTPSAWIKPGSNPPKFDWDALQKRKYQAPIRPSKDFKKYIDTESGYEFDKV